MRAALRHAIVVASAGLAACTVGPDFHEPEAAAGASYVAGGAPATVTAAGITQHFVAAADIRADWWTLFRAPRLDALLKAALAASPTLAEARARLVAAQEMRNAAASAAAWPSASLRAGIERQRIDPAALGFPQAPNPGPFTLYDVGVDIGYTFYVLGGHRRALEGLAAEVD